MVELLAFVLLVGLALTCLYEWRAGVASRRAPPDPDQLTAAEWQRGIDAITRKSLPAAIEEYRRRGPLAAAQLRRAERWLREHPEHPEP